ncbi:tetratricopeptide repeat protein [Verrucomicrobiota bacterium]
MKKVLIVMLMMAGIVGSCFGDWITDFNKAKDLLNEKDYAKAEKAYAKLLTDYPSATEIEKLQSKSGVATCIYKQDKFSDAYSYSLKATSEHQATDEPTSTVLMRLKQTAAMAVMRQLDLDGAIQLFRAGLAEYPLAMDKVKAGMQVFVGNCYLQKKNYAEAVVELNKAIANYPDVQSAVNWANILLSRAHMGQRDFNKASEASVAYIVGAIKEKGSTNKLIIETYKRINPKTMTADGYKTAMEDILKATPAIEANAEFLGKVKSELDKMK